MLDELLGRGIDDLGSLLHVNKELLLEVETHVLSHQHRLQDGVLIVPVMDAINKTHGLILSEADSSQFFHFLKTILRRLLNTLLGDLLLLIAETNEAPVGLGSLTSLLFIILSHFLRIFDILSPVGSNRVDLRRDVVLNALCNSIRFLFAIV